MGEPDEETAESTRYGLVFTAEAEVVPGGSDSDDESGFEDVADEEDW